MEIIHISQLTSDRTLSTVTSFQPMRLKSLKYISAYSYLYVVLFSPEKMSLSGWVCVVTGASRGIGRGIALQLSEAGATVYITGRQERTLKQTATEVKF